MSKRRVEGRVGAIELGKGAGMKLFETSDKAAQLRLRCRIGGFTIEGRPPRLAQTRKTSEQRRPRPMQPWCLAAHAKPASREAQLRLMLARVAQDRPTPKRSDIALAFGCCGAEAWPMILPAMGRDGPAFDPKTALA